MPAGFGVSANAQPGLGAQDTAQLLQRIFFKRTVGSPAFPYGGVTGAVVSSSGSQCIVTVDGFDATGTVTFTCTVATGLSPSAGDACLMVFPANGDHTPWLVALA